jgi:uncharacterized protein
MSHEILWEEIVQPGATWSHVLKRGTALRMTDTAGGANVSAVFYNFECPSERLNIPDTLKAQHIARLTADYVFYSDMGRILCSITSDSVGWHDALGGCTNRVLAKAKYGEARYQQHRNQFHQNAKDGILIELAKWGLSPRDYCPNLNFFSKVAVDEEGGMTFVSGVSSPGSHVELRAEMNVLVILNTSQHPLDPNPAYDPKPVHLTIKHVAPPAIDDPCRLSRPENARGFTLTERYFL